MYNISVPNKLIPFFKKPPQKHYIVDNIQEHSKNGIYFNKQDSLYYQIINRQIIKLELKQNIEYIEHEQELENDELTSMFINYQMGNWDYVILEGGRSSAKSTTAVYKIILISYEYQNKTIICARQTKESLWTSTYADLKSLILTHFEKDFVIKYNVIINKKTNVEFRFLGLENNGAYNAKSIPNIICCYVEEAEQVTIDAWDTLIPTIIRNKESLIMLAFNPKSADSPTYLKFVLNRDKLAGNVFYAQQNYLDNPFLDAKALNEIETLKEEDYHKYEHIYLGKVLEMTEDVVFNGKFKVESLALTYSEVGGFFIYDNQRVKMQYGMDFGFSVDPTSIVEFCFVDKNTIYIHREIHKTKLLPHDYFAEIQKTMPEAIKSRFYADNSRPDTIAQLNRYGLIVIGAEKGKGSVEAGIEYLQGKKIIINPICTNTIYEFYNYRYKIDKNTKNITTDIIDANNHSIDALRYGLCKEIKANRKTFDTKKMQEFLNKSY